MGNGYEFAVKVVLLVTILVASFPGSRLIKCVGAEVRVIREPGNEATILVAKSRSVRLIMSSSPYILI